MLGKIHVGMPLRPTQSPHELPLDLNPGHCGEEPEIKPLNHGKCRNSFYYFSLADAVFNTIHVPAVISFYNMFSKTAVFGIHIEDLTVIHITITYTIMMADALLQIQLHNSFI